MFVTDPYVTVRKVLVDVIGAEAGMDVCGQAATVERAFQLMEAADPQVAVIDITIDEADGLEVVKRLRLQHPQLQVVVFSMSDEQVYAERAIRAGAAGYVMKSEPTSRLIEAIRAASRRELYLSRRMTSFLLSKFARGRSGKRKQPRLQFGVDELTDREMEVFQLTGDGHSTREIAEQLDLGDEMVNVYRRRARRKLGLGSITELRKFAIQWMIASQHLDV